eukprot:765713-Hanusia_phi.AAC.5
MSEKELGNAAERRSISRLSHATSRGGKDSKTARSFVDHELLTENKHHLRKGVNWKFDAAGAPHPFFRKDKSKDIVTGVTSTYSHAAYTVKGHRIIFLPRCRCGATTGYGPDAAVSSDLAIRKCFNCRVQGV